MLCNCVGPRRGEPLCPCLMKDVIKRDGRWIRPEQDLGPVYEFKEDIKVGKLPPGWIL